MRYTIRRLRRAGLISAGVVVLISIVISANTLVFTFVDAFLWRNLPIREPESLVQFFETYPTIRPQTYFEHEFYRRVADQSTTLTDIIAQAEFTAPLENSSEPQRIYVHAVTGNFFSRLGVSAALGRVLRPDDDHVAVLSHRAWVRRFARDATVIGRSVRVGGHSYFIAGIMPAGFSGTNIDASPDVWLPLTNARDFSDNSSRVTRQLYVEIIARLRPGISLDQAGQEITAFWNRFNEETISRSPNPESARRRQREIHFEIRSIARGVSSVRDRFDGALLALWTGTGLLLLIVCANVGGLLLARATLHEKETAIRLALGSSRARIVKQWLMENLTLSIVAGSIGLLFSYSAIGLFLRWMPAIPAVASAGEIRDWSIPLQPDWRSFGFVIFTCGVIAVLCSFAPAWHCARMSIHDALKGARTARHHRFHSTLCALQIALSAVLLVSACLMLRTLSKLNLVDTGFDRNHIVTFSIDPRMRHYNAQQNSSLQQQLVEQTKALPGVAAVGLSSNAVMRGVGLVTAMAVPGVTDDSRFNTSMHVVSGDYFDAMGMQVLSGRDFDNTHDYDRQPTPIIVNEAFIREFFDGKDDVIGRRVGRVVDNQPPFEIIGVASDAHYRSLRELPPPTFYRLFFRTEPSTRFILNVRTSSAPESIIQPVRQVLRTIDAAMPIYEISTLPDEIDRSLWQERLTAVLATWFGIYAMAVSAMGLYGMLAYFVVQQRRELGIRLALGAGVYDVGRLVLLRLLPIIVSGLTAGAALFWIGGRYLQSILYGVTLFDAPAIAAALLVISATTAAAAVIPWLRAFRINTAAVLRETGP